MMLKDNLRGQIIVDGVECNSIMEALKVDYEQFKRGKDLNVGIADYRDNLIALDISNVQYNEEGNYRLVPVEGESLYSNVFNQIEKINQELDGE